MWNAETSNFNLFECKSSRKSNIVRTCFIVLFINCIWKGLQLITFHLIPIKLTRFFSYYCKTVEHVSLDIIANNWIMENSSYRRDWPSSSPQTNWLIWHHFKRKYFLFVFEKRPIPVTGAIMASTSRSAALPDWILFPFVVITYQFTQILSFIFSDLSRNKLTELPQECTDYFLLERLLLYNNSIRTIPDSIVYMQTLHFLDLR